MNADKRRCKTTALPSYLRSSAFICGFILSSICFSADRFYGKHFSGAGDVEYLKLLDISARMFEPDAQYESIPMLYEPKWNGLVEGPTWDAWWIQNSYGTTYAWLPFAVEPYATFIQNSQDLWFNKQGDGKRVESNGYVAPDGCLCDAANIEKVYFRQGDGQVNIHDWFMEATAAGIVLQSEFLLISRDDAQIEKYLSKLERAANFIETRRDPKTGLYLGGVACNLLAPSFGGYLQPDGKRGLAFHAGLMVTYIAGLDRLVELETLAGHKETAAAYAKRRDLAKQALPKLLTDEGYFVNSIDPDGTKHGVFGAPKHGYFESSVNQDAICFRVADDALAKKIYAKIASIPQLRPHAFIIPNYPGYDDMYTKPEGLWSYGYWVNGGEWATCEARMILGYCRLGHYGDAAASMNQMMKFARQFRMDQPLTDFGNAVYQPNVPLNITYDAFGVPAAMIRGLFEYQYKSDRLILSPHIPPTISALAQHDPIRFGTNKLHLSTAGTGHISAVKMNGEAWTNFTDTDVTLPYADTPDDANIEITLGYDAKPLMPIATSQPSTKKSQSLSPEWATKVQRLTAFEKLMQQAGLSDSYEAAHAKLAQEAIEVIPQRQHAVDTGAADPLPEASAKAAEQLYVDTANKLFAGFAQLMANYAKSQDARQQQIAAMWQ